MGFLNPGCDGCGRDAQAVIDQGGHLPATAARQPDGRHADRATALQAAQHVCRVAAGRERDSDIITFAKRLYLLGKNIGGTVVVGNRGQSRGVGGQRNGRQRRTVDQVTIHELGGQVLRVGGAAAVPEQENFSTRTQRPDNRVGCGDQFAAVRPQELFFGFDTRLKNMCDCFFHTHHGNDGYRGRQPMRARLPAGLRPAHRPVDCPRKDSTVVAGSNL